MIYLWISIGSALGGMSRYFCSTIITSSIGGSFPFGTLIVNIIGSFIIGFIATMTGPDARLIINPEMRQFLMVGFCGGFTTFSSFSLQTLNLARDGDFFSAGLNVVLSVILCLASVWLGYIAATTLNQLKG